MKCVLLTFLFNFDRVDVTQASVIIVKDVSPPQTLQAHIMPLDSINDVCIGGAASFNQKRHRSPSIAS